MATASAEEFSLPRYQKIIDLSAIKSKHVLKAVTESKTSLSYVQATESFLPVLRQDQPPVLPEVLELGLSSSSFKLPLVQKKAISDLEILDWVWFGTGFVLGAFITLLTTGMIAFLGTCVTMWAVIVASTYSFYIYMILYEESDF